MCEYEQETEKLEWAARFLRTLSYVGDKTYRARIGKPPPKNREGYPPTTVELLKEHDARFGNLGSYLRRIGTKSSEWDATEYRDIMIACVKERDEEAVRWLLDNPQSEPNSYDSRERAVPLGLALDLRDYPMARILLGSLRVNPNFYGWISILALPLWVAAREGVKEMEMVLASPHLVRTNWYPKELSIMHSDTTSDIVTYIRRHAMNKQREYPRSSEWWNQHEVEATKLIHAYRKDPDKVRQEMQVKHGVFPHKAHLLLAVAAMVNDGYFRLPDGPGLGREFALLLRLPRDLQSDVCQRAERRCRIISDADIHHAARCFFPTGWVSSLS